MWNRKLCFLWNKINHLSYAAGVFHIGSDISCTKCISQILKRFISLKKRQVKTCRFFWHIRRDKASPLLLVHPNALHFGTILHTFLLKICHRHILLTQKPSQGSNPINLKNSAHPNGCTLFWHIRRDSNPRPFGS